MAAKIKSINLLPNQGGGLLDQFLRWSLTVGRLLIILIETLALGTFLYRFSIDMRIVDLHDLIKNQRFIVQQYQDNEEIYRNLHARLAFAKEQNSKTNITPDLFSDVIEMGQGKITFRNLLVSTTIMKMEIQASQSNTLSAFVQKLKTHPSVSSVSINAIENNTSSAVIKMHLNVRLKQTETDSINAKS